LLRYASRQTKTLISPLRRQTCQCATCMDYTSTDIGVDRLTAQAVFLLKQGQAHAHTQTHTDRQIELQRQLIILLMLQ